MHSFQTQLARSRKILPERTLPRLKHKVNIWVLSVVEDAVLIQERLLYHLNPRPRFCYYNLKEDGLLLFFKIVSALDRYVHLSVQWKQFPFTIILDFDFKTVFPHSDTRTSSSTWPCLTWTRSTWPRTTTPCRISWCEYHVNVSKYHCKYVSRRR